MIYVLSAAVRFHAKPLTETALRSAPRLNSKARDLAAELRRLEAKDIKKQLHVNDSLAKEYEKFLGNFEAKRPVPVCCLYDSPLFRSFDAQSLESDDAEWANDHVRIFSGLYGLLRPFDEIQALSLPVSLNTKLTNSKGKFLRDYWRDHIQKEMAESLKRMPMPVIINLASDEDSNEALQLDRLPEYSKVHSVDFRMPSKEEAAEAKGEFLRWALETRCMTVEDLLEFKGAEDGEEEPSAYRISPKSKKEDTIIFEPAISEGAGGDISRQLRESGMSKRAFVKANASGKERYKRTEINKAMIKENKRKRASHAVY
eukprot:gnl/TRDRNA2_/TRDRNA2_184884_c0_seq1.p1 gnl/TRDRNA2_/TRDRNA2_184884_c0~~gnl/TRDRNA2_/TRDRNA2_184884_c0_seq1.p1  ORF type:complete len:315 (-),score=78.40 gnl/TRDRNA2_/TRDRNA2_184884_c0_seq1:122-1066(-)